MAQDRLTRSRMAALLGLLQLLEMFVMASCNTDGCSETGDGSSNNCLQISPYATSPRGVSKSDQDIIVAYHNYFRRLQPQAADMQLMVWDEELASKAQQWSDNCEFGFDPVSEIIKKYSFGQNIGYYSAHPSWNATLWNWYSGGASNFVYGSNTLDFGKIGQFLQMIWGSSSKIGCGSSTCTNFRAKYFVCNYAPAGNDYDRISTPYMKDATCSACLEYCNQGLCDCGGLVCKNGGTLNLGTCSCTCMKPFNGKPDCNLKCDDARDEEYCQYWSKVDCETYYNVPLECPIMCGLCPDLTEQQRLTAATISTTTQYNDSRGSAMSSQGSSATSEQRYSTTLPTESRMTANSVTLSSDTTVKITNQSPDLTKASFEQTVSTSGSRTTLSAAAAANCVTGYEPPHSACLEMSSFAVSPRGISQNEKDLIVALHNNYRRVQNATDMQKMVWDEEAALIAQKWADYCTYGHDAERDFADGTQVGQNVAYGFRSWNETIEAWYGEIVNFQYGFSDMDFYKIGHYTQMVWNATSRVGCGLTTCSNLEAKFYVCNYAPAGNFYGQVATPYTQGSPCSACPAQCHLGLCDCGGLICKHGGTLDLNTCTCACQSPYSGEPDCTLQCREVRDQKFCSYLNASSCEMYYNVPMDCPLMCGLCQQATVETENPSTQGTHQPIIETTMSSMPLKYSDSFVRSSGQPLSTATNDPLLLSPMHVLTVEVRSSSQPSTTATDGSLPVPRTPDVAAEVRSSAQPSTTATIGPPSLPPKPGVATEVDGSTQPSTTTTNELLSLPPTPGVATEVHSSVQPSTAVTDHPLSLPLTPDGATEVRSSSQPSTTATSDPLSLPQTTDVAAEVRSSAQPSTAASANPLSLPRTPDAATEFRSSGQPSTTATNDPLSLPSTPDVAAEVRSSGKPSATAADDPLSSPPTPDGAAKVRSSSQPSATETDDPLSLPQTTVVAAEVPSSAQPSTAVTNDPLSLAQMSDVATEAHSSGQPSITATNDALLLSPTPIITAEFRSPSQPSAAATNGSPSLPQTPDVAAGVRSSAQPSAAATADPLSLPVTPDAATEFRSSGQLSTAATNNPLSLPFTPDVTAEIRSSAQPSAAATADPLSLPVTPDAATEFRSSGQRSTTATNDPLSLPFTPDVTAEIRSSAKPSTAVTDDPLSLPQTPDVATENEESLPLPAASEGVKTSDKDTIVFLHNSLRRRESASDMQLMAWDNELATAAQAVAKDCKFQIESRNKRAIPGKYSYGQLLAVGSNSWNDAINGWYSAERSLIHDNSPNIGNWNGRLVQILRNSTSIVGCGVSQCHNTGHALFVCNYAPWSDQTVFPYTKGVSCAACSEHCNSGLCDCNGLVCKNGGNLDVNSCQCTCKSPYTAVADCGVNCSATEDPWYCGDFWPSVYCTTYGAVPFYCPRMCGVCPVSTNGDPQQLLSSENHCAVCPGNCINGSCDCKSIVCHNGGVLDPATCACSCPVPFRGKPDCRLNCTALTDAWYCGSVWPSAYCEIYSNVKSFCPFMCGLCPGITDISKIPLQKRN